MLPWVILPGTLCTGDCFAPVLAALSARGINVTSTDFIPGATADARDDARELLATGPERFIACAFSLGGMIALQAAISDQSRIAALILISVNGRADPARNADARRAQLDEVRRIGPARMVRDTLWPGYVAAACIDNHQLKHRVAAMADGVGMDRFCNQVEIAIGRPNVLPLLKALKMPALVLSGADDVLTPTDRGAEIAAGLPHARHAIIPDAGHFLLMEKPEDTATAIAEWLTQTGLATAVCEDAGGTR